MIQNKGKNGIQGLGSLFVKVCYYFSTVELGDKELFGHPKIVP